MNESRPRILLAKIGLDGHDRGVKVLARSFRDAGIEVIYTGLWQTSEVTMHAAMQEDVDLVGVSLLSAAHMTIMPELIRHRDALGIADMPIVLGGIVPERDYAPLKSMGVAATFNPGSPMDQIIATINELAANRQREDVESCISGYAEGQERALAGLLTHVQQGREFDNWQPPPGKALTIGVTGAPGVGKSSFIGKLGEALCDRGLKVAVLAIDPSSPVTGGALLGDRLRMMSIRPDAKFFARSMASGEVLGGLGPRSEQLVAILKGFGFDVVLVETVGAGQADVAIRKIVDHTMLLLMPQAGDAIQFSKAGIMEIADSFVLNKCDLAGADATEAQLRGVVGGDRPLWRLATLRNEGIDVVADYVTSKCSAEQPTP